MSLQGDKYGYMPLPRTIDKNAVDERTDAIETHKYIYKLVNKWYRLDMNSVPPVYFLKNLSGNDSEDKEFWDKALPVLRNFFQGAVFDEHHFRDCLIGRSVTEYEVRTALNFFTKNGEGPDLEALRRGVRWIHRQFEEDVRREQDQQQLLFDAHDPVTKTKLQDLKQFMTTTLASVALPDDELVKTFRLPVDVYKEKNSSKYEVNLLL